jgi:ribosomal protein S18 acetylase RimI-like enzyme
MDPEVEIRVLGQGDAAVLGRVADDVFDEPIDPALSREFLADPRHHIAVAICADEVVGFASAIHYVHPDKPPELFIAEVGVAPSHQRRKLATELLDALFAEGRKHGCATAWVATEPDNEAARGLYASTGGKEDDSPAIVYNYSLSEPEESP